MCLMVRIIGSSSIQVPDTPFPLPPFKNEKMGGTWIELEPNYFMFHHKNSSGKYWVQEFVGHFVNIHRSDKTEDIQAAIEGCKCGL